MLGKITISLMLGTALLVEGCANNGAGPQQQAGMVVGGVLGGVLGSQVGGGRGRDVAIIAGTLAGLAIGSSIGRTMDDVDRMKTGQALETVRTGVPSRWKNPDTGASYTVVPTKTYESNTGPCREYTIDAQIGGKPEKVTGTACRGADGTWVTQK